MFEFESGSDDRMLLQNFVRTVAALVSSTIRAGGWTLLRQSISPVLRLHQEALAPAQAALEEFKQQGHVHKLMAAIDAATDDALQSHGLTGAQLRFKLTVIRLLERLFGRRRAFRLLRRLIGAIDNLLDSVIAAVGVGGALKELKDAVFDATEK